MLQDPCIDRVVWVQTSAGRVGRRKDEKVELAKREGETLLSSFVRPLSRSFLEPSSADMHPPSREIETIRVS